MFTWLQRIMERRIRRKAENAAMQVYGVSREYVRAIISNRETSMTEDEWFSRTMDIAVQYPQDTKILLGKDAGQMNKKLMELFSNC